MLPVLARLGGEPQVDAGGNILYRFPTLQQTGGVVGRCQALGPNHTIT